MTKLTDSSGAIKSLEYEMDDLVIGSMYRCNNHVEPKYLAGSNVKLLEHGKKRAIFSHPEYPNRKFKLYPSMLVVAE